MIITFIFGAVRVICSLAIFQRPRVLFFKLIRTTFKQKFTKIAIILHIFMGYAFFFLYIYFWI